MNATEQKIAKFIAANELIQKGDKVLIALSGGSDSVFALYFLQKYQSKYQISICALHINHLLRGVESDSDQEFCREICNAWEIEYFSEKVDVNKISAVKKLSIEEAGRVIRYQKLDEYLTISNSNKIVTAHNLEDNTETVLFNLFRGTGLKGLSGIPIIRGNIIRPFLSTSKIEIERILVKEKIDFVFDKSNSENAFKRNYLRNEIIPRIRENINEAVDSNILKLSKIVKSSSEVIEEVIDSTIRRYVNFDQAEVRISKKLKHDEPLLLGELLKQIVDLQFSSSIEYENIQRIGKLFDQQVGSKIILPDGLIAYSERKYILVKHDNELDNNILEEKVEPNSHVEYEDKIISCYESNMADIEFSDDSNSEYIDSKTLNFPLTLRKWEENDRFNPIGLKGTKKVSDLLTEQKIPNSERKNQLVLLNGEKIIWVVGYRIDESVKIIEKTKKAVKLWVK